MVMTEKKITKKAALAAFRAQMGQCAQMLDEERQCPHWGIDRVNDRAYCGQHINTVYLAADKAHRDAAIKATWHQTNQRSLAWRQLHPSVWDAPPPADWVPPPGEYGHICGKHCEFSEVPA